jgi:hypothetical protein
MATVVTRRPAQAAVRRVDLLLAMLAVALSVTATWLIAGVSGRTMTIVRSAGFFAAFGSPCSVRP